MVKGRVREVKYTYVYSSCKYFIHFTWLNETCKIQGLSCAGNTGLWYGVL